MKKITIAETEYLQMQQMITDLQQKIALLQDKKFIQKLNFAYKYFFRQQQIENVISDKPISIKRGSGKHIITYIADDFTASLNDFKEYM